MVFPSTFGANKRAQLIQAPANARRFCRDASFIHMPNRESSVLSHCPRCSGLRRMRESISERVEHGRAVRAITLHCAACGAFIVSRDLDDYSEPPEGDSTNSP